MSFQKSRIKRKNPAVRQGLSSVYLSLDYFRANSFSYSLAHFWASGVLKM